MRLYARTLVSALAVITSVSIAAPATTSAAAKAVSVGAVNVGSGRLVSPPGTQAGQMSGYWGAISASVRTGWWGKSWAYPSKRSAGRASLHQCRSGGRQRCQWVIAVHNAWCGAVGRNRSHTKFYWAFAYDEITAEYAILARWPRAQILTEVCATGP